MDEQFLILLAEDRDDDVLLIRKAFASAYIPNPLYVVRDGEDAVAYLAGERGYANREEYPLPSLLLLDLKMPRMDGFDVLTWIRQQSSLKAVRVVVLTSSSDLRDVTKAYQLLSRPPRSSDSPPILETPGPSSPPETSAQP